MVKALLAIVLTGCGFSALGQGGDGGGGNPPPDAQGGTGAGPLGALYQGVCCTSDSECSSRRCSPGLNGGPRYCTEICDFDELCNSYSAAFHCDTMTGLCAPLNATSYTCVDPSQNRYGSLPTGACCQQGPKTFEACAGGVCLASGNDTNPLVCSQGCDLDSPCPIGFSCAGAAFGFLTDLRQCWRDPTVQDPNGTYTCQ